jgi:hypothetical protein
VRENPWLQWRRSVLPNVRCAPIATKFRSAAKCRDVNTGRAAQQRASIINHFSPQNIGSNSVILYVRTLLMGHQGV